MASSTLQRLCQPSSTFSSARLPPLHGYGHGQALVVQNVAAQLHSHFASEKDVKENLAKAAKSSKVFDAAARPPFTLADICAAIPKHCWVKDPWRSMSYVARDIAIVLGLAAGAAHLNSWLVWPLYWFTQGTMFWALFVLGHDWRLSHRTHHQNHGHAEKDESWHPLSENLYRSLNSLHRIARFSPLSMTFAYPLYLWARTPGKRGSHFHPSSPLFVPSERNEVLTSTACWSAVVTLLIGLAFAMGPMWIFKLYAVPYSVSSQNQTYDDNIRSFCRGGKPHTRLAAMWSLVCRCS